MSRHIEQTATRIRTEAVATLKRWALASAVGIPLVLIFLVGIKLYQAPHIGTVYTLDSEFYLSRANPPFACRMPQKGTLTVKWPLPYHKLTSSDLPITKTESSGIMNSIFNSSLMVYKPPEGVELSPEGGFCPSGITVIYQNLYLEPDNLRWHKPDLKIER